MAFSFLFKFDSDNTASDSPNNSPCTTTNICNLHNNTHNNTPILHRRRTGLSLLQGTACDNFGTLSNFPIDLKKHRLRSNTGPEKRKSITLEEVKRTEIFLQEIDRRRLKPRKILRYLPDDDSDSSSDDNRSSSSKSSSQSSSHDSSLRTSFSWAEDTKNLRRARISRRTKIIKIRKNRKRLNVHLNRKYLFHPSNVEALSDTEALPDTDFGFNNTEPPPRRKNVSEIRPKSRSIRNCEIDIGNLFIQPEKSEKVEKPEPDIATLKITQKVNNILIDTAKLLMGDGE